MTKILEFRAARTETPKPRSRKSGQTAEIVIFPGVRYERWSSDVALNERNQHRESLKLAE